MRNANRPVNHRATVARLPRAIAWLALVWTCCAGSAIGQSVTLAWDRNSSHTNLAAYIVKYGASSGSYTGQVTVATNFTTAVVGNLPLGRTFYFAVVARAATGTESDPSNEVITNTPPNTSNRAPVVSSGSYSTSEDQTVAVTLTATDADADPLTFAIVSGPANGSLSGTAPNLTYTPAANFSGADSFTFRANDGSTNSGIATISVTVSPVNDAPTLNSLANVTVATNSGARTVSLSGIGSGAANEAQTVTVTATSSNTGLIPNPTVSYTSGNTTGSLTFTPQANASGTATITVTVSDGQAQSGTTTRTFTVVVNPGGVSTQFVQAESGTLVSPMVVANDAAASGGQYVYSATAEQGTVTIPFNITIADDYYIWCRVLSVDDNTDSFYVSIDGGGEQVYGTAQNSSSAWQWTRVNGDNAASGNPTVVTFGQGSHSVAFRSRETMTKLDALYITNDPDFVPSGGGNTNAAPTLNAISNVTINEDASAQTVNLSGISTGNAGETQTLSVTASSSNTGLVPNPTVSYSSPNATGSLSFTPVANATGTATITVTVNDGQSQNNTATRTFTVTVNPVNDAPTLNSPANVTISEDASLQTVNLAGIGSGAANENQTITVTASSSNTGVIPNPSVSYASPNSSGSLNFTPVANSSGTATITVTVNDGQAQNNTVTRTFTVTVNPSNDAPTLNTIANVTINEDAGVQTVSLGGIGSGAANENQTLTVTASSGNTGLIPNPAVSYSSPNAAGSLSFTPVANASGTTTITVTVNDGQAQNNTVTRTFTVTVNPVNDAPTLNSLANVTLGEDAGQQTASLAGISSGAANESQTLTVTASSSNPGLIPNPAVSYSSPNATGSLTFTPAVNASGSATITVTINDGQAQNNATTRTFTVTVTASNDLPTISAIIDQSVAEGTATAALPFVVGDVETAASSLTVSASSANQTVVPNANLALGGSGANRTITVTPAPSVSGSALITVQVADGNGGLVTESFTVNVNSVNQAPTLNALSNLTLSEDAAQQSVNLTGISTGDVNEDDTLIVTATSGNPGLIPNPTVSYISPNAAGTLTFTPTADSSGSATITVTVNDGLASTTRTFTVTVNPMNDTPTLGTIADRTVTEDSGAQTVSLAGIGSGSASETQTLTVSATSSNPSLVPNPTISYSSPNTTGTLTFRPATNATGSATITVTVNDGQAQNNVATRTFEVAVTAVNDLPTITDVGNQTINESSSTAALPFVITDVETPAAGLTLVATSSNTGLVPNSNIVLGGSGANRTVTVTPLATLFGTATITLQITDGDGGTATDTFTLTVNGVNQAPTLNSISDLTLTEDAGAQTLSLSGITSGATNELQSLVVTAVSGNTSLIPTPTVGYASPAATGTLTFTPAANASGVASITVTVNDGQAQSGSFSRSFLVTINSVNDAPTISDIADQSVAQNSATALIPFTVGDVETAAGSLTVAASSSNPTLVPTAGISLGGSGANRTVKVTPALNQYGSAIVSVTVSDGTGGIASDSFVVTVTAGNLPPTINALNDLTMVEDSSTQIVALSGVTSGSVNESQTLTITAVSSNPSLIPNPTLSYASPNATGTLSFTPAANGHGSATITVVVNDGQSINNVVAETFDVTVNSVNDSPTLNAIANANVLENSGSQIVALSGITSGAANENQPLTVTAISSDASLIPDPTVNYFTPNSTGTLSFTPVAGQNGTATITVTVDDGQNQNNTVVRTFTVTVSGANQPPTITDLADLSIPMNSPSVPLALVVGDKETAATSLLLTATSSNPTLVPNQFITFSNSGSNRTANVSPSYGQSGVTIVTLTVADADGGTASDSFVLTVVAPNARPTLDVVTDIVMNEDGGVRTVNLTGITDGSTNESQALIVSALSDNPAVVPHPTVSYSNPSTTGTLTFSTSTNVSGSAYISVTVNDGQAENSVLVRTFRVWINAVNDAPIVSSIPNQLVENNTATDTLPFTISDAELPATSLSVAVTSSNPTLIPNANVALGGSGANRTIKVTPVSLQAGSSTISIFVSDGSLSAVSSFLVTVGATNTPPDVEAPASLATDSYSTIDNVPVLVTDNESRPEDLVLTVTSYNQTVLPSTNITLSGTGSNRWLTLKPVSGKSGDVTLSFALSDGRALTRANCQVTVALGTAPKARLNVRKKGRGEVQPELDGADLTIGASYTITAVPASDEVFTGWSGSVTSSTPSITFVMATNTALEVGFTNSPYLSLKGAYNGLFYEVAEVKQKSSGSFTISTSDRGTYTGKLKLGNSTYPVSGRLDLSCKATNTIVRKGFSTLSVELDFAGGATNQVVGRVSDTVWEAPLLGDRSTFNTKVNPAPYAGSYTLIIPGQDNPEVGPEGDGFASIKVDGNGLASVAGTLADGTKISLKVPLSQGGQLPLYVSLYTGSGSVLSWLAVTNQVTDDIHGLLSWLKPAQASAKIYGGGFTNETFVTGSRFTPPSSTTNRVLELAEANVLFGGGNLEGEWSNPILWSLQNKITNLGDNKLILTVSIATGLINGTVTDPDTGKALKFAGAVHQKQNFASGFLLGTNRSARFVVSE